MVRIRFAVIVIVLMMGLLSTAPGVSWATSIPTGGGRASAPPGDCDSSGGVSIAEVQRAINMFLTVEPVGCGVDANGNGQASIAEVQRVINAFLGVCTISCNAEASPTSGGVPLTVSFSAEVESQGCDDPVSYLWNFGDSEGSVLQNPTHTYNAAGVYQWVVTADTGSALSSDSGTVTVTEQACSVTCPADVPSLGFVGEPVAFDWLGEVAGCSGSASYLWEFGDGGVSFLPDPLHTFASWGLFGWTLVVNADGNQCINSGILQISPVTCTIIECEAMVPATWGAQTPVPFQSLAEAVHCDGELGLLWDFGDGATATSPDADHEFADEGSYDWSFAAVVEDQVCTRNGVIVVDYPCELTCEADVPGTGIVTKDIQFVAMASPQFCGEPVSYFWTFGDGTTSTEQNPAHSYDTVRDYFWSLAVTVEGQVCSHSGTISVEFPRCLIECQATVPAVTKVDREIFFSATSSQEWCSGSVQYLWSFGDGTTSTDQVAAHSYATEGQKPWTLTVSFSGESETCIASGIVDVQPACTVTCSATAPSSVVVGDPVPFTGSAFPDGCTEAVEWNWDFGDGTTSTDQNPGHAYLTEGTFQWTMTVTVEGQSCQASGSVTTTFSPLAVTCTATPSSGNAPLTVTFSSTPTGGNGDFSYLWDFGNGDTSTEQNPVYTYFTGGLFSVTVDVTSGAQTAHCSRTISVVNPSTPPVIFDVFFAPDPVPTGETAIINFKVYDIAGHNVDWTATLSNGGGGHLEPASGSIPDGDEQVSIQFFTASKTSATVTLEAVDINGDEAVPVVVNIDVHSPPKIEQLRAFPSTVSAGSPSLMSFLLKDAGNHDVTWTATMTNAGGGTLEGDDDFDGILADTVLVTNAGLYVSFQFFSLDPTVATLTVTAVDAEGTAAPQQSVELTVQ